MRNFQEIRFMTLDTLGLMFFFRLRSEIFKCMILFTRDTEYFQVQTILKAISNNILKHRSTRFPSLGQDEIFWTRL